MTDFLLVAWVSALIEIRRVGWMLGLGKRWTPGEKLKLLFAGYTGRATRAATFASKRCCARFAMFWAPITLTSA